MTTTELERIAAYDVATRNDPRFDGQFYSAVMTTGIFCRPGCPGRPRAENVRFFSTAAAAAEAGFRPCLRCHPESAPDPPEWRSAPPILARALRLIGEGAIDVGGVQELAGRLNVSPRQLQRLFVEELGAPPVAVAQTRRLLFAKKLIDETDLSMTDIAFSAGYSSVRRFNEAIQQTYARTPSELRRKRRRSASDSSGETVELKLFYREPYNWQAMLRFLSGQATPLVEAVDHVGYRRAIRIGDSQGILSVRPLANQRALLLHVPSSLARYLLPITERVKQMFDLKADPIQIDNCLTRDPGLAPIVRTQPGMRVPGCWDGFEVAVRALIESHAPIRGRELTRALVDAYGEPLSDASDPCLTRLFPTPGRLAAELPGGAGVDEPLSSAIAALAGSVRDGTLNLGSATSLNDLSGELSAIPGFDSEAIEYIALRVLGEPDLDVAGNRLLCHGAGDHRSGASIPEPAEDGDASWRSYAAMYQWAAGHSPAHAGA